MARREGWEPETLDHLDDAASLSLDEPTRLALRLAEQVTRDANAVDDRLFADLRRHFDERAMVELVAVIGLFNYFNRFNNCFQVEPTQPGER